MRKLFLVVLSVFSSFLTASSYTQWTEDPSDPIYNPFPIALQEDYFPYVIYDANKFNGDGDAFFYKMWASGDNGTLALSNSNDGINWTLKGQTNLPINSTFHGCVLYDVNGFGIGAKHYKIWYWTGVVGTTIDVIQFSESMDGLTWDAPISITQDATFPLVNGITPGYFYHLYGPGFVMYNPQATSIPGQPYTFPYIMFYDTSSEGFGPGTSVEQIGLAFSTDGLFWTRFGNEPVLIPSGNATDWDGSHMFRSSLIKVDNVYHLFYSGSNDQIPGGVLYAHGLGTASSTDGINWTLDPDNPIFYFEDGVAWRNGRTYTPFVLGDFCGQGKENVFKMWFTGGTGDVAGVDQGIGYATLPCPTLPPPPPVPPAPPQQFCGKVKKRHHTDHFRALKLLTRWKPSPSQDVVLYKIFANGKLVQEVKSTCPLRYKKHRHTRQVHKKYTITAVSSRGLESTPVKLKKCKKEKK